MATTTSNPVLIIPEIKVSVSFDKKVKKSELHVVKSSIDSAELCRKVFNADTFDWTEEFIMFCLNRKNAVVGYYKVSSGGITGTVADPRVILTIALNCCATGILLAHNHPSGNLTPSKGDIDITMNIKSAAALLNINVIDHIIISDEGYYSFADEGMM